MYKVTYIIFVYKYAFMSLEFLCERFERCYKRMPFRNKLHYYYYIALLSWWTVGNFVVQGGGKARRENLTNQR